MFKKLFANPTTSLVFYTLIFIFCCVAPVVYFFKIPYFAKGFMFGINTVVILQILVDKIFKFLDYREDKKAGIVKVIPKENVQSEIKSWKTIDRQMKDEKYHAGQ